jgi:hypothetical protein
MGSLETAFDFAAFAAALYCSRFEALLQSLLSRGLTVIDQISIFH